MRNEAREYSQMAPRQWRALPQRGLPFGFTLTELLVVICIVSVLAAILFPVFTQARQRAHQTACLSNERQLGESLIQYCADYDERFPNGINQNGSAVVWPAEGWAGQCQPFVKSLGVFVCPSDTTENGGVYDYPVSYGLNSNVVASRTTGAPSGILYGDMIAPARSVLLFEVSGITANIARNDEGSGNGGPHGQKFSAAGNGLDNRLYAQRTFTTSTADHYATGLLGGRMPFDPLATQFAPPLGRHTSGANYVFADGHARWVMGSDISSGKNARAAFCAQDNTPSALGCFDPSAAPGTLYAAGTGNPLFAATFSVK